MTWRTISDEETPRRRGAAKMPRAHVTRQSGQALDKISNMETHITGPKLSISVAKTRIESVDTQAQILRGLGPIPR